MKNRATALTKIAVKMLRTMIRLLVKIFTFPVCKIRLGVRAVDVLKLKFFNGGLPWRKYTNSLPRKSRVTLNVVVLGLVHERVALMARSPKLKLRTGNT